MDENDFTSLDNFDSLGDPMEMTKLFYDRYLQRKQSDSLQSKTTTATKTDDFQKEIVEEIRKLNLALKQIQMAVDDIPAKIEQAIKSFHLEQQPFEKQSLNLDQDNDHDTTIISDDIEILDYFRNTDLLGAQLNDNDNNINNNNNINTNRCDQSINLSSLSSNLQNYYETDFYRHWSRHFHRQIKSPSSLLSSSSSSLLSNELYKLSLNVFNGNRTWLYHLDHPCPKANQSIMPYSRELDLDFWLMN